jgi:peptide/nickel transport system ATP-binding protein
MPSLLELKNVSKIFYGAKGRRVRAVDKVNFSLQKEEPQIISLVGESGSGKTTIARMILGLLPPTEGGIYYLDKDIYAMDKNERKEFRREVQAVFQDPYGIYNPFYRVDRVLEIPIKKFNLATSKEDSQRLITEALEAVGLRPKDIIGKYPHQLSGGERQRVMLARLYLLKPKLIVADEPISMIDVALRALFLNILLDFKNKYGISCIFITHDLSSAYYLGENLIILYKGRIVERGKTNEILTNPYHPYTKLLIKALLPPDPEKRILTSIGSDVRLNEDIAPYKENSCHFANRCPSSMDICREKAPVVVKINEDHEVRCFLYDEKG